MPYSIINRFQNWETFKIAKLKVLALFDLAKLTNLDENTFNVEAVFDDYLLVKAHPYGTLWLIDRSTNEAVALYKTLLTKEQQQRVDTWDKTDMSFQGDGLHLLKEMVKN
ncbi:hypothetical protein D3C74_343220 [compost metagenome]